MALRPSVSNGTPPSYWETVYENESRVSVAIRFGFIGCHLQRFNIGFGTVGYNGDSNVGNLTQMPGDYSFVKAGSPVPWQFKETQGIEVSCYALAIQHIDESMSLFSCRCSNFAFLQ